MDAIKKREYNRRWMKKNYWRYREAKLLGQRIRLFLKKMNNQEKNGYKTFQEDPIKWEEILKEQFPALVNAKADIGLRFLRDKKSIPEIVKESGYSKVYVYESIKELVEKIEEISDNKTPPGSIIRINANSSRPSLTQDEFDKIKKLLFQGETIRDITTISKRSKFVVGRVRNAKDLDEYFKKAREYYSLKNPRPNPPSTPPEPFKKDPVNVQGIMKSFPDSLLPPHWQLIADAIDAMVNEQVEIKMKQYKEELKKKMEEL